ncbi:MAG: condensation domain-containing protein, partial [bacterium]
MHHIVSDGWSMARFLGELGALYPAFSRGEPSPLPPLAVQYGDFALWQRRRLSGEVLSGLSSFWQGQLEGAPGLLELPTDRRRPAVQAHRGAQEAQRLPDLLAATLREFAQSSGATLFIALATALAALFHRLSGQDDVVLGTPIAGRTRSELEPLVGFFVNTVALRSRLEDDPAFGELLARMRATTLAAHAHQEMPFEKLVEELAPERNLGHSPIFQAIVSLQNTAPEELALAGVEVTPMPVAREESRFDLEIAAADTPNGLEILWRYDRDLWDGATVARFAGHFATLLAAAVAEPGRPVAELPLLSAGEREQVLVAWNDTARPYPRERCVHELVEEQARL